MPSRMLAAVDLAAAGGGFLLARACWEHGIQISNWRNAGENPAFVPQAFLVFALWVVVGLRDGLLETQGTPEALRSTLLSVTKSWTKTMGLAAFVSIAVWGYLAHDPLLTLGLTLALMLLGRTVCHVLRSQVARSRLPEFHVLVIGDPRARTRFLPPRSCSSTDYRGWLTLQLEQLQPEGEEAPLGHVDDLPRICSEHSINTVVICPTAESTGRDTQRAIDLCDAAGIPCHLLAAHYTPHHLKPVLRARNGLPCITFRSQPGLSFRLAVKRTLDLAVTATALVLLAPLLLVVAALIKLQDGGPILFRQRRVGCSGRMFWCYKFRTMVVQAESLRAALQEQNEQDGPAFKIRNDPRITRLGGFLRKYSIDELPQLFNVLKGEMSIVGPRPPTPDEVERYEWWQRRRVSILPGLTCIWQVRGRNRASFREWVEMDLFYIDNWSLWLDCKLICQTALVVLRGTGS